MGMRPLSVKIDILFTTLKKTDGIVIYGRIPIFTVGLIDGLVQRIDERNELTPVPTRCVFH